MLEGALPEYGILGKIRQPIGGRIPKASPSNAFLSKEGTWFLIAANSDALFKKLTQLMGQESLANNPKFISNHLRVKNCEALEKHIALWVKKYDVKTLQLMFEQADIPSSVVYTIENCTHDEQFLSRRMIQKIKDSDFGEVLHPGVVPCFSESNNEIRWTGPEIGQHNNEVFSKQLELTEQEIEQLYKDGVC